MIVAIIAGVVLFGAWVVSGYLPTRGIEMPEYEVVATREGYEIRQYRSYLVVETDDGKVGQNQAANGFRVLFDYISGNNKSHQPLAMTAPVIKNPAGGEKIPMTAPVIKSGAGSGRTIAFVVPKRYTRETLPRPKNMAVRVRVVETQRVAALQFSGTAGEHRLEEKARELRAALDRDGVTGIGPCRVALYNPPWTPPFMRRNEILIDLPSQQQP